MIRLGLCCQFLDSPIQFRTATHRYVATLDPEARRAYLADVAGHNAGALAELDPSGGISGAYEWAGALARAYEVRLSLHPDQFVVLNSEGDPVVKSAVQELELQAEVGELVGADVIVLHGGGAAGGIPSAIERLERGLSLLSPRARQRIALENDDRCFTPRSLEPLCSRAGVPLVYDAHHHRCLPDGLSVSEASELAFDTWGEREPCAHISSPRDGWQSPNPRAHADYIDPADFPDFWRDRTLTVDVEAKAKERAVLALKEALEPHSKSLNHKGHRGLLSASGLTKSR